MGKPVSLLSLVNIAGRINYVALQNYAARFGKEVFLAQLPHPAFMGKELAKGRLMARRVRTADAGADLTSAFLSMDSANKEASRNVSPAEGMGSAIYVLLKDSGNYNHFTIGRTSGNSLIFNDNSISKEHAELVINNNSYLLRDLHSTNGTSLNGVAVKNQEVEVRPGDEVKLGRLTFLFMAPADLYDKLMETD